MVLACVIGWHREHFLGDIVAVGREGGVRVSRYEIKGSFFIPPIIHRLSWRRVPKPPPRYYMAKAGVARLYKVVASQFGKLQEISQVTAPIRWIPNGTIVSLGHPPNPSGQHGTAWRYESHTIWQQINSPYPPPT